MTTEYAFPHENSHTHHMPGMTLRDYFAAKALQGILAANTEWSDVSWDRCKAMVIDSFNIADEMLKAREQS
jgi:hypothetical protein